jgi:signal transduction histidine kinase
MQEILTNIYKHAQATQIQIGLHYIETGVEFMIADDGIGFDLEAVPPDHHGLRIMRERAGKIGATMRIETAKGEGTYTHISWPLPVELS